jgi:hypothetical protein
LNKLIVVYEHVICPPEQATAYLERYLSRFEHEGAVAVDLRLPSAAFGLADAFSVTKRVEAHLTYAPEGTAGNRLLHVSWHPGGGYPNFSGSLSADADADGDGTVLSLSGRYEPPGGPAGDAFDAALGYRIARATLRDLLERIRDGMEAEFRGAAETALHS